MITKFKFLSSLEKVFFDFPEELDEIKSGSMLKNEIYSFQLACELNDAERDPLSCKVECKVEIDSPIEKYVTLYEIGYVPSALAAYPTSTDTDYITKTPGMFPDPMKKIHNGSVRLYNYRTNSIWITVDPLGEIYGEFPITLKLYYDDGTFLQSVTYTVKIIDAELPKLNIKNTGWFHGDCIAALHNVDIQSEEYIEILKKYIKVYVKFGHNMILTPIFTPPLDTDIGGERPTNQLVGVTLKNGKYRFDFSLLEQWVNICVNEGVEYFEIAHFFTQWGAYFTPKIMANVDGKYRRIFGWDVEACSDEYVEFLDAFLPKLVDFLKSLGIYEKCMFHISDEPTLKDEKQYSDVLKLVTKHIDSSKFMDAISDYAFYEKDLIYNPVVCNNHIGNFLKNNVDNLWTYYCCAQGETVANRFMAMPSYRNRILGYQLYKNNINGFLHWGFNFWFSQRSREVIDPYRTTDADVAFPSGDSFVVYPLDKYGDVVTSFRLYVFNEALQDMRALNLLEKLTNRNEVEDLIKDIDGFDNYPRSTEYILNLRNRINKHIEQLICLGSDNV